MNIFLQLEANPVQMHLLYFYPAVLVNSTLDHLQQKPDDKPFSFIGLFLLEILKHVFGCLPQSETLGHVAQV